MRMKVRFYNLQVEVLYLLSDTLDTKPVQPVCDSIASTSITNIGSNSSLERLVGAQECDSRFGRSLCG